MTKVYEIACEKFDGVQTFDEAKNCLPSVMHDSLNSFFLESVDNEIPTGYTVDSLIEYFRKQSNKMWVALSIDAFLLGYSVENKSLGIASVWSYQDYKLQETYSPGFIYFIKKDPIKKYMQKLGHKPQTKQEMKEGLRRVFEAEKKEHKGKSVIGGGNVDCTIVKKNGELIVEDLGPIK